MGSVVSQNVGEEESVTGNFAIPHNYFIRNLKSIAEKENINMETQGY